MILSKAKSSNNFDKQKGHNTVLILIQLLGARNWLRKQYLHHRSGQMLQTRPYFVDQGVGLLEHFQLHFFVYFKYYLLKIKKMKFFNI